MKLLKKFIIYDQPISVNHMYGQTRQGRRFLIKRGKDYKENIKKLLKGYKNIHSKNDVFVSIKYYFKDKRRRDVTNYDKPVLDSLSGVIYYDDSQIQRIILEKYIDKENPRTEVEVRRK